MAYTFNGTNQYLERNTGDQVGGFPATLFVMLNSTSFTQLQMGFMYQQNVSPYAGWVLGVDAAGATDRMYTNRWGTAGVTHTSIYASGQWYAIAARSTGNTHIEVMSDTTVTTGPTTSCPWPATSPGDVRIGARKVPTAQNYLAGGAARVAAWNVSLTDDELNSLYKGFSPRRVRPQNLKIYAPLVREAIEVIRIGGTNDGTFINVNSATVSDQPRGYGV